MFDLNLIINNLTELLEPNAINKISPDDRKTLAQYIDDIANVIPQYRENLETLSKRIKPDQID